MSRLIDLTDKTSIEAITLIRWRIPDYREDPGDAYVDTTLRFCDSMYAITTIVYTLPDKVITDSETFTPLGILLNVTETNSELRATPQGITFSLTAFTDALGYDIRKVFLNSKILGTEVEMWRYYRDIGDVEFLTGEPIGRFQGVVSNFSIDEDWSPGAQQTTQTLVVQCNSRVEQLANKVAGCRTNPADRINFYSDGFGGYDKGMDRVLKLKNANFNFGAPM